MARVIRDELDSVTAVAIADTNLLSRARLLSLVRVEEYVWTQVGAAGQKKIVLCGCKGVPYGSRLTTLPIHATGPLPTGVLDSNGTPVAKKLRATMNCRELGACMENPSTAGL